jgi:uncharacterized membrane protein YkoI
MKGEKNMMKKYIAAAAVSMAVLGALTGCGSGTDIGRDAALEAALNDAGVSESDTTRLKVSEDRDDGRKVYEIRFDVAEKEYDYEILASDGSIISSDIDTNENYTPSAEETGSQSGTAAQDGNAGQDASSGADTAQAQNSGQENSGTSNTQQNAGTGNADVAVSMDEAISIALGRVEGATEQDIRIELDYDDGCYKYEGEIIYQMREYDFEIDANTGTILEWSEERD